MTNIRFASYQPGDEKHILELFSRCFPGRQMDPQYWDWRFRRHPSKDIMIQLAWLDNQLVGHYAISPVILSVNGQYYKTAQALTTMCDRTIIFQGFIKTLTDQLHETLLEHSYSAMWCFPNSVSHPGYARSLGWRDVYEIPTLTLDLKQISSFEENSAILELKQFGPEFAVLWDNARPSYDILIKRDQQSLKWRFQDNPVVHYRILGYFYRGELQGYLVFSVFGGDQFQIVDMFNLPEPIILHDLIKTAINLAKDMNMRIVKIWMPIHHPVHVELERMGFVNKEPITYLGGKPLKSDASIEDIWDVRRWYFTMSASDNF